MAEKAADHSRNMAVYDLTMTIVPNEAVRLVNDNQRLFDGFDTQIQL